MAETSIVFEVSPGGTAVVLLDRPAKRNAFDEDMIAALSEVFETLKGADHVHSVFLKGSGSVFSAGADIDWMRRQSERSRDDCEAGALETARMFRALHDLPQLTVALVQGGAMGIGAGLLAACDWTASTRDAKFRFPEVRLGLIAATAAPYLAAALGPRRARGLLASAQPFDAAQAYDFGLIDELVDDDSGLQSVMSRLSNLAAENGPEAVAASKRHGADVAFRPLDDRLAKETAKRIAERQGSDEARAGVAAFIERRPPTWRQG